MDNDKLTVKDAADRWDVSIRTIRRWVASGRLQAVKAGRDMLIEPSLPQVVPVQRVVEVDKNIGHGQPLSTEILSTVTQAHRRTFHWQIVAMSAIVTVGALGSIMYLGDKFYRADLETRDNLLAAVKQQAIKAESRSVQAENIIVEERRRADDLTKQIIVLSKPKPEPEPKSETWLQQLGRRFSEGQGGK